MKIDLSKNTKSNKVRKGIKQPISKKIDEQGLYEEIEWSVNTFLENAFDDEFVITNEEHNKILEEDDRYDYYNDRGTKEEVLTARTYNLQMYKLIRKMIKLAGRKRPKLVRGAESEEKEFLKCKYDICYYLENYCYIPAPGGNVRLLLNNKLRTVAKLFEASVITSFMTSR